MYAPVPARKAPFRGAFFVTACLTLLTAPAAFADCGMGRVDETVAVASVIDGDTVRLSDGRHLRFIGLDTPELDHEHGHHQPLAETATRTTRGLLAASGNRLQLHLGTPARDRYGRLLAHPFLVSGENLSDRLLREGLATLLVIPPNTWQMDCRMAAEREAREAGRGLWALPKYRPVEASGISTQTRGYRRVRGEIVRIGRSAHALWINLRGGVAAKIETEDLPLFAGYDFDAWIGRRVEIRGRLYGHRYQGRDELRMRLHHPGAIDRLN